MIKNTIRDGGSTALYSTYTIYTAYTIYTVKPVYTVCAVYSKLYTVFTGIWLFRLLNKMLDDGRRVTGYPSGYLDESTCSAKKWKIHLEVIFQPQYLNVI